jgi:hypothetical protein
VILDPRPCHPRHLTKSSPAIKTKFTLRKVRVAATGWVGLRSTGVSPQEEDAHAAEEGPQLTHILTDIFGPEAKFHGLKLVEYLGPCVFIPCGTFSCSQFSRQSRLIVDKLGKVCAFFGGRPDEEGFMKNIHDPAVVAMERARAQASLSEARTFHRRGNWTPLTAGDSHGGGQIQPSALVNGVINTAILCTLLGHFSFIRWAGFATGMFLLAVHEDLLLIMSTGLFANWAPNLFDFYVDYMGLF